MAQTHGGWTWEHIVDFTANLQVNKTLKYHLKFIKNIEYNAYFYFWNHYKTNLKATEESNHVP